MMNAQLENSPVSYTHLDVYKRQAIALAVSISLVSIFMMDGFRNMLFDIIIEDLPHVVVSPKAVSYTHLDVYKRQATPCR